MAGDEREHLRVGQSRNYDSLSTEGITGLNDPTRSVLRTIRQLEKYTEESVFAIMSLVIDGLNDPLRTDLVDHRLIDI